MIMEMPAGLQTAHRRRLAAFAALAVAIELFVWFGWSGVTRDVASRAATLAASIQGEGQTLQPVLKQLNAKSGPNAAETANAFLKDLDQAIATNDVHVVRLVPDAKNERSIQIELVGGFPNFLRFAGMVETLGATLRDLQITKSRDANAGSGDNFSFTLDRPSAPGFHGAYIDSVRAAASAPDLRDIFMPVHGVAAPSRDLSAKYQLTAITKIGGRALATINNLDYAVGDPLGSGTVADIADDQVTIANDSNTYVLRFQPTSK